jgi:hypothetical protein
MRLVEVGSFRCDDGSEVDSGSSGSKPAQPFRAVRQNAEWNTPLQRAEHFLDRPINDQFF